jgi:protease I
LCDEDRGFMKTKLSGKKIAILVADGFEQVELTSPKETLEKAGAQTQIISPSEKTVKGWDESKWAKVVRVDVPLKRAKAEDYDALVLPGGVMNPDKLRRNEKALEFVRSFFDERKPVAAICHGPWTLIDAGVIRGRKVTSYHSIQTDLKNAGAEWVDEPVVVDNGLVTSRKPGDLPAFNRKMVEEFSKGFQDHVPSSMYSEPAMAGSGVD